MAIEFDPQLEVNGAYLLGVIGSLNDEDVRPFRAKHNLTTIDPNKWYPARQVLPFYDDLQNAPNGMFNLIAIGMNIVKHIEYPPQVRTMADALAMAQQMHDGGWRNGDPGELRVDMLNERSVRFTFSRLPLPADLVYGLCYGMVRRFVSEQTHIVVERQVDGRDFIYTLKW